MGNAVEGLVGEHLRIHQLQVKYQRAVAEERHTFVKFRLLEQQADDLAAAGKASHALTEKLVEAFDQLGKHQAQIESLDDQINRAIKEHSKP